MNWGHIIKQLREEAHLTQMELADKSGLGRSHISNIERGRYKTYKPEVIERIAHGLEITTKQVIDRIYLREDIIKESPVKYPKETPEQILERFRVNMPATVPIYPDFPYQAGTNSEAADYVAIVRTRVRGKMLEAYIVKGQSLKPDVQDGDIIIVDRNGQIDNGDIVACLYEDMLHLARLRKIAEESYLENNRGRMKLEEVKFAAPVIEVRRRLR